MENLTKHQIVLVALLVSFITSITTGIFTVALISQAPAGVTQTINRVVERTIEKVVPTGTPDLSVTTIDQKQQNQTASIGSAPIIKVVTEADMIVSTAEIGSRSLVRIYSTSTPDGSTDFVSLGIVFPNNIVLANKDNLAEGAHYAGTFADGKSFVLDTLARNDASKIAYFKINTNSQKEYVATSVNLGNSDSLKLGQTVVSLNGQNSTILSRGVVTALPINANNSGGNFSIINTDTGMSTFAAPLFDTSGNLIAVRTAKPDLADIGSFLPINQIKVELQTLNSTLSINSSATSTNATSTSSH
jgi:hypothetical protein